MLRLTLAMVAVLLGLPLILAALRTKPMELAPSEAAALIRAALEGSAAYTEVDEFLNCRIADPVVAAARERFADILEKHGSSEGPSFLTPEGRQSAEALAKELEGTTA